MQGSDSYLSVEGSWVNCIGGSSSSHPSTLSASCSGGGRSGPSQGSKINPPPCHDRYFTEYRNWLHWGAPAAESAVDAAFGVTEEADPLEDNRSGLAFRGIKRMPFSLFGPSYVPFIVAGTLQSLNNVLPTVFSLRH